MRDLYRANTFIEVIGLLRHARRRGTRSYSYRQLADQLGYRSPRSLAMVHKGQRPPSAILVRKIVAHLSLPPDEAEFVTLLGEKAIREHKQILSTDLIARIRQIQSTAFHGDELHLTPSQIQTVQERLRKFLIDLVHKFGQAGPSTSVYKIDIRLKPEAHTVCAADEMSHSNSIVERELDN